MTDMTVPHHEILTDRRDFLRRGGAGFGSLALLHEQIARDASLARDLLLH
jgi:hypothetical protein